MKHCIFYLPYELEENGTRARIVRPKKMIQAFKECGYDVFLITGFARERKKLISELKSQIAAGVVFDFMYSEAGTIPTLLTQPHHFPTHPFLDFGFFRYIKRKGIKIGLFYPDVYWRFDNYGKDIPAWKRLLALKNYELDIHEYEKYLDRFYVPSIKVSDCVGSSALSAIAEELPPGADDLQIERKSYDDRDFKKDPLTVFYVGGLGEQYQISEMIKAVVQTPHTRLILCCRTGEWEKEKAKLQDLMNDQIEVIHKSGKELEPYYRSADLCSLMFKQGSYIELARPVKAYEYLAHELPVLASEGTEIGEFVKECDIGWTIDNDAELISNQLIRIMQDPSELVTMGTNNHKVKKLNTWNERAKQVERGLT